MLCLARAGPQGGALSPGSSACGVAFRKGPDPSELQTNGATKQGGHRRCWLQAPGTRRPARQGTRRSHQQAASVVPGTEAFSVSLPDAPVPLSSQVHAQAADWNLEARSRPSTVRAERPKGATEPAAGPPGPRAGGRLDLQARRGHARVTWSPTCHLLGPFPVLAGSAPEGLPPVDLKVSLSRPTLLQNQKAFKQEMGAWCVARTLKGGQWEGVHSPCPGAGTRHLKDSSPWSPLHPALQTLQVISCLFSKDGLWSDAPLTAH